MSVREKIIDNDMANKLMTESATLIEKIEASHRAYKKLDADLAAYDSGQLAQAKEELKTVEDEAWFLISQDKDKFKNDLQRKAGVQETLKNSEPYKKAKADLRNLELKKVSLRHNADMERINYETARNRLAAWNAQMVFAAGLAFEGHQELKLTFNVGKE